MLTEAAGTECAKREFFELVSWQQEGVHSNQERFDLLRRASDFSLRGQRKVTKREATLLGACRAAPVKSVSRGRAFRQGFLPWRKGADIHVSSPSGLSSTTHRLTRG